MVYSIVKQSIDIRLNFKNSPRITASSEICVLCGILCKICNIPLPDKDSITTTAQLKEYTLSNVKAKDEKTDKLLALLSDTQKESEPITDEWIEVLQYGYDHA